MFNRNEEFVKDNEFGNWGEGITIKFIEYLFRKEDRFVSYWYSSSDISKKISKLKKWDLRFGCYTDLDRVNYYDKFDVEVKTDGFVIKNDNLIFEKSCNGKKSGVFSTESKYFVYFLPLYTKDNFYIIPSIKLIEILKDFNTHIISGGDYNSNTLMYKINRSEFDEVFKSNGGKIITYNNYEIPDRFNKTRFKENLVYISDTMSSYENPLDL